MGEIGDKAGFGVKATGEWTSIKTVDLVRLRAQIAEAQEDTERWEWMEKNMREAASMVSMLGWHLAMSQEHPRTLRDAVDAAIEAGNGKG